MRNKFILFSLLCGVFTSCATVFTGARQKILFDSDVQRTHVIIDGKDRGKTPVKVRVKKGYSPKLVKFVKAGYKEQTIALQPKFNAVSIFNLGNILFWSIDVSTGAITKYSEPYHRVVMEPLEIEKSERIDD